MSPGDRPHDRWTRRLHLALAAAVVSQLATSQLMTAPGRDRAGDLLFELHEYVGIGALVVVLAFWLYVLIRRLGTRPGLLFPWLVSARRQAVLADARRYLEALSRRQLPDHVRDGALSSAVHGLGLLLVTAMAATGLVWFLAMQIGDSVPAWGRAAKEVHEVLSNVVWVYIAGHGGMALLNHLAGKQPLSDMWSLRR